MTDKTKTENDLWFEELMAGVAMLQEVQASQLPEPSELERVKMSIEEGLRKRREEDSDV
ncbi:hypothetical protein [Pseudomonas syringae]|uniref:hypothetical protein n=1 Tax=Pseudomonas syringae TaxID=317 RepID=UPI001BCF0512|nr:hypothetical protein [Pseudomonas syringae]MBS7461318.1 hypothetical protein [Pseudomonas syringae]